MQGSYPSNERAHHILAIFNTKSLPHSEHLLFSLSGLAIPDIIPNFNLFKGIHLVLKSEY